MTQKSKRQTESPSTQSSAHGSGQADRYDGKAASLGLPPSLSLPKNRFESLSQKYSQELLLELEQQKQRLMNKAKTLDPSGQAQSQGAPTSGVGSGTGAGEGAGNRGSELGSHQSQKWAEDEQESPERDKSDAAKVDRINRQI